MTPEVGPHGYLVLRRYNSHDLPVRFFWDRDDAFEYCDTLDRDDDGGLESVLGITLGDPVSVVVIHFVNGKPIALAHERCLEGY